MSSPDKPSLIVNPPSNSHPHSNPKSKSKRSGIFSRIILRKKKKIVNDETSSPSSINALSLLPIPPLLPNKKVLQRFSSKIHNKSSYNPMCDDNEDLSASSCSPLSYPEDVFDDEKDSSMEEEIVEEIPTAVVVESPQSPSLSPSPSPPSNSIHLLEPPHTPTTESCIYGNKAILNTPPASAPKPLIVSAKRLGDDIRNRKKIRSSMSNQLQQLEISSPGINMEGEIDSMKSRSISHQIQMPPILSLLDDENYNDDDSEKENSGNSSSSAILFQDVFSQGMKDSDDTILQEFSSSSSNDSCSPDIMLPSPELPPVSASKEVQAKFYWELCYGTKSHELGDSAEEKITESNIPRGDNDNTNDNIMRSGGCWSANRAPPTKSCFSSRKNKPQSTQMDEYDTTTSTVNVKLNVATSVLCGNSMKRPRIKFGSPSAVEFDYTLSTMNLTPLPSEFARERYSMDVKILKVEEQELCDMTKENNKILNEWEKNFEDLLEEEEEEEEEETQIVVEKRRNSSGGRRGSSGGRRGSSGGRRSSGIYGTKGKSLLEDDNEYISENNAKKQSKQKETGDIMSADTNCHSSCPDPLNNEDHENESENNEAPDKMSMDSPPYNNNNESSPSSSTSSSPHSRHSLSLHSVNSTGGALTSPPSQRMKRTHINVHDITTTLFESSNTTMTKKDCKNNRNNNDNNQDQDYEQRTAQLFQAPQNILDTWVRREEEICISSFLSDPLSDITQDYYNLVTNLANDCTDPETTDCKEELKSNLSSYCSSILHHHDNNLEFPLLFLLSNLGDLPIVVSMGVMQLLSEKITPITDMSMDTQLLSPHPGITDDEYEYEDEEDIISSMTFKILKDTTEWETMSMQGILNILLTFDNCIADDMNHCKDQLSKLQTVQHTNEKPYISTSISPQKKKKKKKKQRHRKKQKKTTAMLIQQEQTSIAQLQEQIELAEQKLKFQKSTCALYHTRRDALQIAKTGCQVRDQFMWLDSCLSWFETRCFDDSYIEVYVPFRNNYDKEVKECGGGGGEEEEYGVTISWMLNEVDDGSHDEPRDDHYTVSIQEKITSNGSTCDTFAGTTPECFQMVRHFLSQYKTELPSFPTTVTRDKMTDSAWSMLDWIGQLQIIHEEIMLVQSKYPFCDLNFCSEKMMFNVYKKFGAACDDSMVTFVYDGPKSLFGLPNVVSQDEAVAVLVDRIEKRRGGNFTCNAFFMLEVLEGLNAVGVV